MSIKKSLFIAFAFISFNYASAQAFKVAYINTDELLMSLPEVKIANDSLVAYKASLETKLQKMALDLRTKAGELEKKKNEIAPIQYQKEVEILKADEQKIMGFEQAGQADLKARSDSFSGPLEKRINDAIKEVAAKEGYNYVINSSQGIVLYADATANIIDKVKMIMVKK